jgi:hypothetical protein
MVLDGFRLQDAQRPAVPSSLTPEQVRQLIEANPGGTRD